MEPTLSQHGLRDSRTTRPGQAIEVFKLVFHVPRPSRELNVSAQHPKWPEGFKPIEDASLEIVLGVACENAPLTRQIFQFSGIDLEDILGV